MRSAGCFPLPVVVVALGLAFAPPAGAQVVISDLETLGGYESRATDINDAGQVTGTSDTRIEQSELFSWTTGGGLTSHGTLGGWRLVPNAISRDGEVAGWSYNADDEQRAFFFAGRASVGAELINLGTLGGSASSANDTENFSVVAWSFTRFGDRHAFIWTSPLGMRSLGTLGGDDSEATAINGHGVVVGWSLNGNGDKRGFVWTAKGGMQELGTLGGAQSSAADVNNDGLVVGWAHTSDGIRTPVTWSFDGSRVGKAVEIALPADAGSGYATRVTENGQAIGRISNNRSFYWTASSKLVEIPGLGGDPAWTEAKDINEAGAVVGRSRVVATGTDPYHAFLWRPGEATQDLGTLRFDGVRQQPGLGDRRGGGDHRLRRERRLRHPRLPSLARRRHGGPGDHRWGDQ